MATAKEYLDAIRRAHALLDAEENRASSEEGSRYFVNRGWNRRPNTESYQDALLPWKGQNAEEFVAARVAARFQTRVLDLGCGEGRFLRDFQTHRGWRGFVHCEGVTNYPYHHYDPMTRLGVWWSGVKIHVGDIYALSNALEDSYT